MCVVIVISMATVNRTWQNFFIHLFIYYLFFQYRKQLKGIQNNDKKKSPLPAAHPPVRIKRSGQKERSIAGGDETFKVKKMRGRNDE